MPLPLRLHFFGRTRENHASVEVGIFPAIPDPWRPLGTAYLPSLPSPAGAGSFALLTDGTGDADRVCTGDPTDRQPDGCFFSRSKFGALAGEGRHSMAISGTKLEVPTIYKAYTSA